MCSSTSQVVGVIAISSSSPSFFCHLIRRNRHQHCCYHCRHHVGFVIFCRSYHHCLCLGVTVILCAVDCCVVSFHRFFRQTNFRRSRQHHTSCLPYRPSHHTCTTIAFAFTITVISHTVDCCVRRPVRLSLSLSSCYHRHHCFLSSYSL